MKGFCLYLSLLFLVFSVTSSWAEEFEYKEYTVKKGDTLWDITGGELKDSFQWPLIWKENPKVKNPDRIYPGQVILIPIGKKEQKEIELPSEAVEVPKEAPKAEEVKAEPPKPKEEIIKPKQSSFLISKGGLLFAGYITNSVPYLGEVSGSPTGRKTFGLYDEVYLKTPTSASSGERFYVIRKVSEVYHPADKKLLLGWLIEIVGVVEVIRSDEDGTLARITDSYTEIIIGDILDKYYDVELPYVIGEPRKPDLRGYIVATKDMRQMSGQTDIVHIDKGSLDGLEPGDVLSVIEPGTKKRQSALIQVIATKEHTSTALVLKGVSEVSRGNEFGPAR